mmetsp:Transcript_6323/g.13217  ORF Transcript_6323/g.13217 Transcript_6323/m.13217 type:complete len:367 (-) Transcript_6323:1235-2335(-)
MASFDDSEDGVFGLSKALAEAEAEFHATLNGSIGDIEKVTRQNSNSSQRAGGIGSLPDSGSLHSDDLSVDDEVGNLEGLAMEDLAKELRALDKMEWTDPRYSITGTDGTDAMNPTTTSCRAPFEGKGRRARARRARIKREIKAREEKATKNGSTSKLPSPLSSSSLGKSAAAASPTRPSGTGNNTKPLKSLETSSLGRVLAESKHSGSRSALAHLEAAEGDTMANTTHSHNTTSSSVSSSPKSKNKRYGGENGGRGKRRHGSCRQKQHGGSDGAGSKPYEGKGRRARARRAKERRQAKQAPASTKDDARDKGNEKLAPVSAILVGRDNMDSSQRQGSNSGCTNAEEEKDTKPFPDFSLRRAVFSEE